MTALRDVMDDLAAEVRPVDLSPRVSAGLRRRRQRRVAALSVVSVLIVLAGAVGMTALDRRTTVTPAKELGRFEAVWISHTGGERLYGQTGDGKAHDLGPFDMSRSEYDLSPDGTRLAYATEQGVEVLTLATMANEVYGVSPLVAGGGVLSFPPVWSPDGRSLAYPMTESLDAWPLPMSGFQVIDVVTRAVRTVRVEYSGALSWSPDGSMLALSLGRDADSGIAIVTTSGRIVRTFGPDTWALTSGHAWSPDGTRLLVRSLDRPGTPTTNPVSSTIVVSATTGDVIGEPLTDDVDVWLDATHVLSIGDAPDFAFTERSLDGVIRRTTPFAVTTPDFGDVILRPAS